MPVIEYKFNIAQNGKMEIPGYVEDRGHWYNSVDHTYLGWVKPESEREYWVPDTILELDRDGVINRVLAMHAVNPIQDMDSNGEPYNMDSAQVTALVGDWYDGFIADK